MRLSAYYPTATNQTGKSGIFSWPQSFPSYNIKNDTVVEMANSGQKAKAKINGVVNFISWLQNKYPDIYTKVMQSRPELAIPELALSGLGSLNDTQQQMLDAQTADMNTPPSTSWGKSLLDFVTPLVNIYAQKQLFDLNIKRAEVNLPPLESLGSTVNIGVSHGVMQAGTISGLIIAGLALLLILKKKK